MLLTGMGTSWNRIGLVLLAGAGIYLLVIALTRLAGVRSLAKMSAFDFAATVAVGSIVASVAVGSVPLAAGAVGLGVLFTLQYVVAVLRRQGLLQGVVDNRPILLMADGQVLEDHLSQVRLARTELWSQLRQAGIHRLDQVHAVVFETTGDISVLPAGRPVDPQLLEGVRGAERLS